MVNQANGRIRTGTAEVRVSLPVAEAPVTAAHGFKRDIALVYTIPVMVNGRPT